MGNVNSSFGVEIEFVVAIQRGTEPRAKPRMFQQARSNPIIFEDTPESNWWLEYGPLAITTIRERIEQALVGHTGDRVINSPAELLGDMNAWHLREYATNWDVKRDLSVVMDPKYAEGDSNFNNYTWMNIELATPALRATDASYAEIHHVITTLRETFWMIAPKSAGLHIHYGRGRNYIPPDDFRKIAALLYAADPILTQLHPSVRREEGRRWCNSNRLYSNLAHGMTRLDAETIIEASGLAIAPESEPATGPASEVSNVDRVARPTLERGDNFISIFPRGSLEGYIFSKEDFSMGYHPFLRERGRHLENRDMTPVGIIQGAQEILSCESSPVVAVLMSFGAYSRLAYNVNAYGPDYYRRLVNVGGHPSPDRQPKRTIEFRQPAGTVDADEIIAHAKVVVRLCEYASSTSNEELWKTISDLALGEENSEWYDVFDFLVDLGLQEEARVIQRQLANFRGLEIIDEERGLSRDPNAPPPSPKQSDTISYLCRLLSSLSLGGSSRQTSPERTEPQVIRGSRRGYRVEEEHASNPSGDDLLWLEFGTEGPVLPD
ncbi:putative amidoligase enzyme-domain-containing protein [Annulohypoxylon moriforme]|nr:putative amidoligase enzyme-domain-containing protein [Annulohypoxylon moriforme]